MAWPPNQAAATPKINSQPPAPNGFSRGTSIPAMATPMNACAPSTSYSAGRRHRHATARRLTQ
jgi:hypothetical protein